VNVLPFPGRAPQYQHHVRIPDLFAPVVTALHTLGEPATAVEIAEVLMRARQVSLDHKHEVVTDILQAFGPGGSSRLAGVSVFRTVGLAGGRAWAFTAEFRNLLRVNGVEAALRPAI
jgi:hypothetical protein